MRKTYRDNEPIVVNSVATLHDIFIMDKEEEIKS